MFLELDKKSTVKHTIYKRVTHSFAGVKHSFVISGGHSLRIVCYYLHNIIKIYLDIVDSL